MLAYLEAQKAAPTPPPAPAPRAGLPTPVPAPAVAGRTEPLKPPARQITAQRTTEAKQTIPHFYLTMEIDMEEALARSSQKLNEADESLQR